MSNKKTLRESARREGRMSKADRAALRRQRRQQQSGGSEFDFAPPPQARAAPPVSRPVAAVTPVPAPKQQPKPQAPVREIPGAAVAGGMRITANLGAVIAAAPPQPEPEKMAVAAEEKTHGTPPPAEPKAEPAAETQGPVHPLTAQAPEPEESTVPPLEAVSESPETEAEPEAEEEQDASEPETGWWDEVDVVKPEEAYLRKIGSVVFIDPNRIVISEQVRSQYNDETILELGESIKRDGQEEPSHVSHLGGDPDHEWLAVNGHRRILACQRMGIPVYALVVIPSRDKKHRITRQLLSNVPHEELTPADIARNADELEREGMSLEDIGRILHFGVQTVKKYLLLARESNPELKRMLRDGEIGPDVAAEITRTFVPADQPQVAREVKGKTISAARLHIRNVSGKTDKEGGRETTADIFSVRARTPYDDRRIWKRFGEKVSHWLAHHGDLTPEFYSKLLEGCSEGDFEMLKLHLERIVNNANVVLKKLSEAGDRKVFANAGSSAEADGEPADE